MPSLKKAIGVVKDRASIGLAKVGSNNAVSNLEVAVLKATSHDEDPMDENCVGLILQLVASNKFYAATCANAISRRVGKTQNWAVALKSLMLVLRIFQDGDPYFPREVLHTMRRGGRILNLLTFRDQSKAKNPWNYTAYVRLFALYLEQRLDCFLMGKLQRRVAFRKRDRRDLLNRKNCEPIIRDMKPAMLLDQLSYWQRLLDQAIVTRPTGAAKTNGLIQISFKAIVQESFDLYRDVSEGLTLLWDNFFNLQYQSCLSAFQMYVKAAQQFEELSVYYDFCKNIGIERKLEYPSVQKISDEVIETLREFIKDQSSFPNKERSLSPNMVLPSPQHSKEMQLWSDGFGSKQTDRYSEKSSEYGSQPTSLEDLFRVTDRSSSTSQSSTPSPCSSISLSPSIYGQEQYNVRMGNMHSRRDYGDNYASHSSTTNSTLDFVSVDEWHTAEPNQHHRSCDHGPNCGEASTECWELALVETVNKGQQNGSISGILEPTSVPSNLFSNGENQAAHPPSNPFLDDDMTITTTTTNTSLDSLFQPEDVFSVAPTFRAASAIAAFDALSLEEYQLPTFQATQIPPTFIAQSLQDDWPHASQLATTPTFDTQCPMENRRPLDDPFSTNFYPETNEDRLSMFDVSSINKQKLQLEQQLWLQQQNKIIAKYMAY